MIILGLTALFFLFFSLLLKFIFLQGAPTSAYFLPLTNPVLYLRLFLIFYIAPLSISLLAAFFLRFYFRFISCFLIFVILLLLSVTHFSSLNYSLHGISSSPFWKNTKGDLNQKRDFLIAHAGGKIDDYIYTDSREAVENSLKRNFSLIELDLTMTSDNKIICAHSWQDFFNMTNTTAIPTEKEFKKYKLYEKYTPLTGADIRNIMLENPDLILVTDKITDYSALKEILFFPDRMIIETFSFKEYQNAKQAGYTYPAYAITSLADIPFIFWKQITMVTVSERMIRLYPSIFENLHRQKVTILVYRSDDPHFVTQYQGTHFSLLYTDSL